MKIVFAFDIDSTVIYSDRHISNGYVGEHRDQLLYVGRNTGYHECYMHKGTFDALKRLRDIPDVILIPATCRTVEEFRQITPLIGNYNYAVCNTGVTLLEGTQENNDYRKCLEIVLEDSSQLVYRYLNRFQSIVGVIEYEDSFLFNFRVRDKDMFLKEWHTISVPEFTGLQTRFVPMPYSDTHMTVVPRCIDKQYAIQWVIQGIYEPVFYIAAGDSITEECMFNAADISIKFKGAEPGLSEGILFQRTTGMIEYVIKLAEVITCG